MKSNEQKGITLIAIIITIVLLLILSGIVISIATNGSGIFSKTAKTTSQWNDNTAKQNKSINETIKLFDYFEFGEHDEDKISIAEEPTEFLGESVLNTKIELFNDENLHKNFELSFQIDSRDSKNANRAVIMGSSDESGDPWPGIVFRIQDGKYLLQGHSNSNVKVKLWFAFNDVQKVTLVRIDDIIYYSINDEIYKTLADFSQISKTFAIPLTFGGIVDESGNESRQFKGTISNTYIKFLDDTITKEDYGIGVEKEYRFAGTKTFTGSKNEIIDTGIYPFKEENIDRNFYIFFEVKNIEQNNANQAVLINAKDETGRPWPGFVLRCNSSDKTAVLKADRNSGDENTISISTPYAEIKQVKIIRINKVVYYSINNNPYQELMDFTNIVKTFNAPIAFGGFIKPDGTLDRPFKGELSNLEVKYVSEHATLQEFQDALQL